MSRAPEYVPPSHLLAWLSLVPLLIVAGLWGVFRYSQGHRAGAIEDPSAVETTPPASATVEPAAEPVVEVRVEVETVGPAVRDDARRPRVRQARPVRKRSTLRPLADR